MATCCARCRGPVRSLGSRRVVVVDVVEGRLTRSAASAPRLSCTRCGHVFVDRGPTGEGIVLDRVVGTALEAGLSGAARKLGCDERSIRSVVRRWISLRERDVPDARPKEMALWSARSGGEDRMLVCDADEILLLDVVEDPKATVRWMAERTGRTELLLLPVDETVLSAVAGILPGAVRTVAPAAAGHAIVDAAARTLHAGDARRNFREDATLLPKPDADLDDVERDEIASFWSTKARALRRHVLALVAGLGTDASLFVRRMAEVVTFLDAAYPRSALGRLLVRWGGMFSAGAGKVWLDVAHRRISALAEMVGTRMSRTSFDLLRIALVFGDEGRRSGGGTEVGVLTDSLRR